MGDIYSKSKRSSVMGAVHRKNTPQEIAIRKILYRSGYRYRLHKKDLPGSPDIVLKKYNTVIFVNGCFWHGHENCSKSRLPKDNNEFWQKKRNDNLARDKRNYAALEELGWKVLIIWQCEIKKKNEEELKNKILKFLNE